MAKEANPLTLTAEETEAIFDLVRRGDLLPCGGHRWKGDHNRTTPVFELERDGVKKQRSARPLLWLIFEEAPPPGPLYSLHDPPCMEHLTLDRKLSGRNAVTTVEETPVPPLAGTGAVAVEEPPEASPEEAQPEAQEAQGTTSTELVPVESPTREFEPDEPLEPRRGPNPKGLGLFLGLIRTQRGAERPWRQWERPRVRPTRRQAVAVALVALVGLGHVPALGFLAGLERDASGPEPATTINPPPTPQPESPPTPVDTSTTQSSIGPAPMGVPDPPAWAPGEHPMTLSEHVGVVYTATDVDGVVLYVGRTLWANWRGWWYCYGKCEVDQRAKHRPCAHLLGRGRASRWAYEIQWGPGDVHSRTPVPGRLSYRLVLGAQRTKSVEADTIARLLPRENVALNPNRPKR